MAPTPDPQPDHAHSATTFSVTESSRERARVLAAGGDAAGACDHLESAADVEVASGEYARAAADLDAAIELASDAGLATRQRDLLLRRAWIAADHGLPDALHWWRRYGTACERDGDLDGQARSLMYRFSMGSDDTSEADRREMLELGACLDPGHSGWSLACASMLATLDGRYDDAARLDEATLVLARARSDQHLEADALESLAFSRGFTAEPLEIIALTRQSQALARSRGDHRTVVKSLVNTSELYVDALQTADARATIDELGAYVQRHGLDAYSALHRAYAAYVQMRLGDVAAARTEIDHAARLAASLPEDLMSSLPAYVRAWVLLEQGEADADVRAQLALAHALTERHPYLSFSFEVDLFQLRCDLLAGTDDDCEHVARTWRGRMDEPSSFAIQAVALARLGVLTDSEHACNAAGILTTGLSALAPITQLACREVAALTDADARVDGRITELTECRARWASAGRRLDAAMTTACIGALQLSAGRRVDATQSLTEAHGQLVTLDAARCARIVAALIERSSGAAHVPEALMTDDGSGVLTGLSVGEQNRVDAHLARVSVRRGRTLYEPDAPPNGTVFIIRRGHVLTWRAEGADKRIATAVLGPGDVFGGAPAIGLDPAGCGATALDDGLVCVAPASVLDGLATDCPQLGRNLLAMVGAYRDRAERTAAGFAWASVRTRLARVLLDLDQRFGHPTLDGARIVNVALTQSELADLVGATRKAIADAMGELRRAGVIELRGKRVVLLSPTQLAALTQADG